HTRFSRDWSSDVCSSDLDSLTVQWPDGNTQVLHQVLANQNIVLWQAEAIMPTSTISKKEAAAPPLFEAIDIQLGLDYQHHDGDYLDFKQNRLMPNAISNQGPILVKAD